MGNSDQEIAFRFAVDRVNADRDVLPKTRLTAQMERIPPQDSFYAAKQGTWQDISGTVFSYGAYSDFYTTLLNTKAR